MRRNKSKKLIVMGIPLRGEALFDQLVFASQANAKSNFRKFMKKYCLGPSEQFNLYIQREVNKALKTPH